LRPGVLQEIRSSSNTILASTERDHIDVSYTTPIGHLLAVDSVPIIRHGSSAESIEDDNRPAMKKNKSATRKRDSRHDKRENRTVIARRLGLSKYDIEELVLGDQFSWLWSQYRARQLWGSGKYSSFLGFIEETNKNAGTSTPNLWLAVTSRNLDYLQRNGRIVGFLTRGNRL